MNNVQLIGRLCEDGIIEWLAENVDVFCEKISIYDKNKAESLRLRFYNDLDDYCYVFDAWMNADSKTKKEIELHLLLDSKFRCSECVFEMEEIANTLEKENEFNIGYA